MNTSQAVGILFSSCNSCGEKIGECSGGKIFSPRKREDVYSCMRGYFVVCEYFSCALCPDCAESEALKVADDWREFAYLAASKGIEGLSDEEVFEAIYSSMFKLYEMPIVSLRRVDPSGNEIILADSIDGMTFYFTFLAKAGRYRIIGDVQSEDEEKAKNLSMYLIAITEEQVKIKQEDW